MDDHFSIFTDSDHHGDKLMTSKSQTGVMVLLNGDSDHHGDKLMTSKSQTGVMVLLNGVPVHWRSNKQPKTADSPACAEI